MVPPYVPHRIASETRFIVDLIIEPETLQRDLLPAFMRERQGVVQAPAFVARACAENLDLDFGWLTSSKKD